jgi:hypothetical protein
MNDGVEGVVPHQQRARHRDRHQQHRETETDPTVKRPPESPQARRLGHVKSPPRGRHREWSDFNEGSREILVDTGNYRVDQYL